MKNGSLIETAVIFVLATGVFFMSHGLRADEIPQPATDAAEEDHRDGDKRDAAGRVNLDMKLVYGQYNNMLSTVNLSQDMEDFIYIINSYFKRSNDFGYMSETYENSSYYENRIGFTGNLNHSDKSRSIFDMELNNDSRGMFNNTVFSREEKEKAKLSLKNIIKLSRSFEMHFTLGGAQYVHSLRSTAGDDPENSRVNQVNVNIGGEYIWSTTNGIKFKTTCFYYDYLRENVENDLFFTGEVVDDFYLTRNIGISVGVNLGLNRDDDPLLAPIVSLSIRDFRNATIVFLYRYDMVPFRPENYYLQQKYIMPTYDLPPGRVHRGDMRSEFRLNDTVKLIAQFTVEKNNNFYNYYPVPGNVLSASALEVISYRSRFDFNLSLFGRLLEYTITYESANYRADSNITYNPAHGFYSSLLYNGSRWTFEWNNRYYGQMYINPDEDAQIGNVIIGDFGMQRKMLESFFAYIKVENLYNNRYNLRDGYPEQGITVLGGIRVLI